MFYFISKSFFCKPIVSHLNIHIPLTTFGKNCSFIFYTISVLVYSLTYHIFSWGKKNLKIYSFIFYTLLHILFYTNFQENIYSFSMQYPYRYTLLHIISIREKKLSETYSFIFYTILHIISILCLFLEKYHYYKCICEYLCYIFDVSLGEHLLHIYLLYLSSNF